jgi:hypothetical protein
MPIDLYGKLEGALCQASETDTRLLEEVGYLAQSSSFLRLLILQQFHLQLPHLQQLLTLLL